VGAAADARRPRFLSSDGTPTLPNVADDTHTEGVADEAPPPVYLSNCDPGDECDERPAEQPPLAA
jgi:hypothetical protein